ncbi:MAG: NAD(P)-binding domain-containing protein [Deltaproteobacteria bacterium]|nr:NAD(P)-binding domain-containing protein [Deltaproteobacteria bacterium]
MRIGILGTGVVGEGIGQKLIANGHEVRLGSRTPDNAKGHAWARAQGPKASAGTFASTAEFGELLFNCTHGESSIVALSAAGPANLGSKILIDVANAFSFTNGAIQLAYSSSDSLGEHIQNTFPALKVVKALNTLNVSLMVNPGALANGEHDLMMAGNDADAKAAVRAFLTKEFGWKHFVDLGDIKGARACEGWLSVWGRLYGTLKTPNFSMRVVK